MSFAWDTGNLRCIAGNVGGGDKDDADAKTIHEAADMLDSYAAENARLTAENAALRAEVERLTPREMTAQQACDVLNAMNHLYSSGWEITGDTLGSDDEPLVACQ